MTYPIGAILLIKGFKLPTEEKDKFFIVLDHKDSEYNLLSMTTSKFYFDESLICHGIINKESATSMFCFLKNTIIGKNGFSFKKHTFINHKHNIHKFEFDFLSKYTIEEKDVLLDEQLKNLIYSFYQNKNIPKKYKEIFEDILTRICK